MSFVSRRGSDRISLTVLLETSGVDSQGNEFKEPAKTLMVSRNGAMIILNRELKPEQNMHIRRRAPAEAHRQSRVRVVNQMGRQRDGFLYSVEILDQDVDMWGVEFPAELANVEAVAKMLLECTYCHLREVAYLNDMELRAFEINRGIARHCKKCNVPSIWIQVPHEEETKSRARSARIKRTAEAEEPSSIDPEQRERQRLRLQTRLTACIRQAGEDDELAVCEDISPIGMCFRSKRRFDANTPIEVAVPYSPESANIFLPARVVYSEELPKAGLFRHGTEYRRIGPRAR
jgi:hypothetical protein